MKKMWLGLFLLILIFRSSLMFDPCEKSETCTECIRNPTVCVWCAAKAFNETRCLPRSTYKDGRCPEPVPIEDSNNVAIHPLQSTQINPAMYKMNLRIGEKRKFNFTYKNSNNPVDLYFLLDASRIMIDKQKNIASKIESIYNSVKVLTKDVTIGMGTFIDKNTFNTEDSKTPYSFKHQLTLTEDYQRFKATMRSMSFGTNRDPPTGCLDALAQAIVCENIIGWRNKSRKIIILITSYKYHEAGDGRATNIYKPYDGQCYLDKSNKYKKELEMDYPSVGIINKLLDQYKVSVLFFVESSVKSIYQRLSDAIVGSYIDDWVDSADSTTGQTLSSMYKKIIENVTLNVDVNPESIKNIKVTLYPDCTRGKYNEDCLIETDKVKKFEGAVEVLDYNGMDKASVAISVHGVAGNLFFDINILSYCDCKQDEGNSSHCNGRPLECGLCKCDDGNSECNFEGTICNGHPCSCGICQCTYPFTGKFCQCDSIVCGKLKNGNGECIDGECRCKEPWSGNDCTCTKSTDTCKDTDGRVCNDRGNCRCGACDCQKLNDWDPRQQDKLCNILPGTDSHNKQCVKLGNFVLHYYNEDKVNNGPDINVDTVESIENLDATWNQCPELRLDNGCYTNFAYRYHDDYGIELLVQTNKNCEENIWKLCGILFITLILVGIGTLIAWKVVTDRRDKKEYMSLMKLYNLDSGARTNVLYVEPCVTFRNPSYKPDAAEHKR